MSFKKHSILLLTGTMLCSLELHAMDPEKNDGSNAPTTTAARTPTILSTSLLTAQENAPTTPGITKQDSDRIKAIKDPYERHLATLHALTPTIKQAIHPGATNLDDEITRIRCLWNLGSVAYRAAALEILERKALADNSPVNLRINLLKKLAEFLHNAPSQAVELKLLEAPSAGGMSTSQPSRLVEFYKKTLEDISQSNLAKAEQDFQVLKLKTFYNRLPQKLAQIDSQELSRDINKSFRTLQASVDLSKSLLHKIDYFQNFYLKSQPAIQALEHVGEEISKVSIEVQNPEEAKVLKRLASKISFKLASLVPNDIAEFKKRSREYSYYNQASQLGHSLAKYHLGELCNVEYHGQQKSEWYDPDRAYGFYLRAAQDNNPLAAYKLAKILEKGDDRLSLEPDKENALMWYQKAAKQGHPYSQYELAQDLLSKGNTAEALKYLFLAAEAGYEKAQLALAQKYENGKGVEKNPAFAFYWYGKAAHQGETLAYFPLGYAYEKGIGTDQDYERAFHFYKLASKNAAQLVSTAAPIPTDEGRADVRLGKMYLKGKGHAQSDVLALQSFQQASGKNNADGHYYVGLMQFMGKGSDRSHPELAKISFEEASKHNHRKALFQLGIMHQFGIETQQNYETAINYYEKAEQQKSVDASYFLGGLHNHGLGVKQDKAKALTLWEKAATAPHIRASFKAGKMYVNAYLETQDEEKAKKAHQYLKQAADANYVDALYLLALLHEEGIGCDKSPIDSMTYYTKAAEAGHASAQYKLGEFYEGIVEEGHNEKALMWYEKAAKQQHIEARLALGRIHREGHMVPKDLKKSFDYARELSEEKSSVVVAEMKALVKEGSADALKWFEEQAAKGNPVAQNYMARAYEEGVLVPQNLRTAIDLYQQAALKGRRSAENRLSELNQAHLLEALNIKPTVSLSALNIKKSEAKKEKPDVGTTRLSPEDVFQQGKREEGEKNYAKAMEHYTKAADQNHPSAQYSMGVFYDHGYHVSWDHQKAIEWYTKAANHNHVEAQLKLGEIYCFGKDTKNYKEAIKWYKAAAALLNKPQDLERYTKIMESYEIAEKEQSAEAQYQIGRFYDKGSIMVEDLNEAMKWYKLAAAQGHPEAQKICQIQADLGASLVQSRLPSYFQIDGLPKN